MKLSYFNHLSDKQPVTITIDQLVYDLRSTRFATQVQAVRTATDTTIREQAKRRLPAVTISGVFADGHAKNQLVSHNGLIQLDFDKVTHVTRLKAQLIEDPYTLVAFISPSGTGIKAIVQIPVSDNKLAVKHLKKYYLEKYDAPIDEKCCDVSRLCFVSHDPDTYYHKDAPIFTFNIAPNLPKIVTPTIAATKHSDNLTLFDKAVTLTEKTNTYTNGHRNDFVFKLACHCNRYGISQAETENLTTDHYDLLAKEIQSAVKSAYAHTSEHHKYQNFTNGKILSTIRQPQKDSLTPKTGCVNEAVWDELTTPIADSSDADADFAQLGFFIRDGRYFVRESKRNHWSDVEISNFVMQSLYQFEDGSRNTKRLIKLQHHTGTLKTVEVFDNETTPEKFETILKSCRCTFFGTAYQLKKIFAHNMDQEHQAIALTQLGYHPQYDIYVLADSLITPDNQVRKVNPAGIVSLGAQRFYLPAFAQSNLHNQSYEEMRSYLYRPGNLDFAQWSLLLYQAYGIHGVIGMCYLLQSLFFDQVMAYKNFFPFLYLFGPAGTGKTTLIDMLLRLFCVKDTGIPATGSTVKGISRSCSQKNNALNYLKEWDKNLPDELLRMFKSYYDGVAYKTAQSTNDNRTNTFRILSGIVIDGNVLPTQELALFDRMIVLMMGNSHFTEQSRQAYTRLITESAHGFGTVLREILRHRAHYVTHFKLAWTFVHNQLKGLPAQYPGLGDVTGGMLEMDGFNISSLPERTLNHVTFILSVYVVFHDKLTFPFQFRELSNQVLTDVIEKNDMLSTLNDTNVFWDAVNFDQRQERGLIRENIHYQKDESLSVIYFKLRDIFPCYVDYCTRNKMNGVDYSTMLKLITSDSYPPFMPDTTNRKGVACYRQHLGTSYRFRYTNSQDAGTIHIGDKEVYL